jgi:hypothetical protein
LGGFTGVNHRREKSTRQIDSLAIFPSQGFKSSVIPHLLSVEPHKPVQR